LSRRGRVVPEVEEDSVREIFLYSYRMIYEIVNSDVYILAIIHDAEIFLQATYLV